MYWWGICVAIRVLSHVIGAKDFGARVLPRVTLGMRLSWINEVPLPFQR